MSRRCIVCGKKSAENAPDGVHYYPRNKKEALIWQRSMGAIDTSVEDIQKCCCVCFEHIPQFVVQATLIKNNCKSENGLEAKSSNNSVHKFAIRRPSLNVLFLPGAVTERSSKKTIEIYVKESSYANCCEILADVDETEVTVLQTPTQIDDYVQQEHNAQCGDNNCTDVLVLGQRSMEKSPCGKCPRTAYFPNYSSHNPHNLPPAGDENGELVLRQQQRIYELEVLIDRQNNWNLSLQQKINELYTEFGRVNMQQELTQIPSNLMYSETIEQRLSQSRMSTGGSVQ